MLHLWHVLNRFNNELRFLGRQSFHSFNGLLLIQFNLTRFNLVFTLITVASVWNAVEAGDIYFRGCWQICSGNARPYLPYQQLIMINVCRCHGSVKLNIKVCRCKKIKYV